MIELRKELITFLKTIHSDVYFQFVPDNATYPYLVIDFPTSADDGEILDIITIDIDGWDRPENGSTIPLETLMDALNKALNKKIIFTEELAISFFIENKLSLVDEDKKIRRRKYVYQARSLNRE